MKISVTSASSSGGKYLSRSLLTFSRLFPSYPHNNAERIFLWVSITDNTKLLHTSQAALLNKKGHSPTLGKCPFYSIQLFCFDRVKPLKWDLFVQGLHCGKI